MAGSLSTSEKQALLRLREERERRTKRPETAEEAERLSASLHDFVRAAWPVIEPGTPLVDGWYIEAICDHLQAVSEGRIKKLIINQPPRTLKSSLVSVLWPAWEWTLDPTLRMM